jgi:hypothetical protein
LIGDRRDLFGQREDHMEVLAVEEFRLAMLDPFRAGERLAFRTMPIPARNGARSITCIMVTNP